MDIYLDFDSIMIMDGEYYKYDVYNDNGVYLFSIGKKNKASKYGGIQKAKNRKTRPYRITRGGHTDTHPLSSKKSKEVEDVV